MADYAASVTSLLQYPGKLGDRVGVGIYAGQVDVSNYNQTLAEITEITGKFKSVLSVVIGPTDSGYILRWNATSGSIEAYYADYSEETDGPLIEAATDTDVGAADFIAIGLV